MPTDPILNPTMDQEEPVDYYYFLSVVFQEKRKLILFVTLFSFIASFIFFASKPNIYQAHVEIFVEKPAKTEDIFQQPVGSSSSEDDFYMGTQISLMKDLSIADKVEEEFGLAPTDYKIKAKRVLNSRVISLSIEYKDGKKAADIANKFANLYLKEKSRQELFVPRQLLKILPNESEVDGSATGNSDAEILKDSSLNSISLIKNDDLITKLTAQKIDTESKIREFSQRYKWKHPVMLSLNEKLQYIDEQIKTRKKEVIQNLRTSLSGERNVTNVSILSPAQAPLRPIGPRRFPGIFFSTVGAFIFSLYLAVILEKSNRKIRYYKDLEGVGNIAYIGAIPALAELGRRKKNIFRGKTSDNRVPLAGVLKENSMLSDSIAKARTYIMFSTPYEQSKTIMVTSTIPNEGKSTVTALLALSFAATGRKVLLIDADMRRPSLHTYLGVNNKIGLHEYLQGGATLEEVIQSAPDTTLQVITGGTPISNPTDLIASERFSKILPELIQRYDRILIDVPPALYIPDASIMAKHIQGSILVCRTGFVEIKSLKVIKDQFDEMKPRHTLIGAVINAVDFEKYGMYYSYFKEYKNYYVAPHIAPTNEKKKSWLKKR